MGTLKKQRICRQLMLFSEDSLASLSAQPGTCAAVKMTVTSGLKCAGLYQKSSRVGLLLKMFLGSSELRSTMFCMTWRVLRTKQSRLFFRLTLLAPRIEEIGYGLWPTSTANDAKNDGGQSQSQRHSPGLNTVVKLWPTPLGSEATGGCQDPEKRRRGGHTPKLRDEVGGSLNPQFVEWLMGAPIGWTDLEVLETASSYRSRILSGEKSLSLKRSC